MNTLITLTSSVSETLTGDIATAGLYALLGFGIVIAALGLLVVCIIALNKVINIKLPAKKVAPVSTTTSVVSSDEAVVAAISAALAVIYASETTSDCIVEDAGVPALPFRIKSIKKI